MVAELLEPSDHDEARTDKGNESLQSVVQCTPRTIIIIMVVRPLRGWSVTRIPFVSGHLSHHHHQPSTINNNMTRPSQYKILLPTPPIHSFLHPTHDTTTPPIAPHTHIYIHIILFHSVGSSMEQYPCIDQSPYRD